MAGPVLTSSNNIALFYTCGSEWTARMNCRAERAPDLNIFSQNLIARDPGGWHITDEGRALLEAVERPPATATEELTLDEMIEHMPVSEFPPPPQRRLEDHNRRRGVRRWTARTRRSA